MRYQNQVCSFRWLKEEDIDRRIASSPLWKTNNHRTGDADRSDPGDKLLAPQQLLVSVHWLLCLTETGPVLTGNSLLVRLVSASWRLWLDGILSTSACFTSKLLYTEYLVLYYRHIIISNWPKGLFLNIWNSFILYQGIQTANNPCEITIYSIKTFHFDNNTFKLIPQISSISSQMVHYCLRLAISLFT
jgi:hypothetical protein